MAPSCTEDEKPFFPEVESGDIITIAGIPKDAGFSGDGGSPDNAKLGCVIGLSVDEAGDLYFADGAANVIRKISDDKITTVSGRFRGFNQPIGDPAPEGMNVLEADLDATFEVAVSADGDIFFSETSIFLLRGVIKSNGQLYTLAGKAGTRTYPGDGQLATTVGIYAPQGIAVDPTTGDIYYSDTQNNAVRKISDGKVTTISGFGPDGAGYIRDNGPALKAKLNYPKGLAFDDQGNLYISDAGNNVIRKVTNGFITTIAGNGQPGYTGDNGPATEAKFFGAHGIAVDKEGNLYIADNNNSVIRKVTAALEPSALAQEQVLQVSPVTMARLLQHCFLIPGPSP
ncbi:MAG: hypothetical protein WKF87_15045 [Chryseolinea sp.]